MTDITIYHNPKCGTSRNTLAMIRNSGAEPQVIEYLKTPPTREQLLALIAASGLSVREVMRSKEALFTELGLADPARTRCRTDRRHAGAPDPDQPSPRGHAAGYAAVPAV